MSGSNKHIGIFLLSWSLLFFVSAKNANAELSKEEINSRRDLLTETINKSDIGSGYAHILTFFIEPDISASTYDVNDEGNSRLNIYKLPMQETFEINKEGWELAVRGVLAYATLKNSLNILGDTFVDSKWKTFSGSVGTGLIVPVWGDLDFITAVDFGLSHMKNSSDYTGFFSGTVSPLLDGILYNWDTNALIGSLVFGFDYKHLFKETYDLDVKGRYTYSHVSSFNESNGFPSFDGNAQTLSLAADLTHPLGFSIAQYPVSGVAHLGNTTFVGDNRDALGFDFFFDLGYSLEVDISTLGLFFNSLRLGYQWSVGDNVQGHTILVGWEFTGFQE